MPRRSQRLVGSIALILAACSPRGDQGRKPAAAPSYTPESALAFDDQLAPQLFGFDPEGRDPAKDPRLGERTVLADLIVPAKVETVSRSGGVVLRSAYQLELRPTGPALVGKNPQQPLVLSIPAGSPAYPWVDGAGARWVGTRLILFGKRFHGTAGDTLHFRGEPDTKAVRAAIDRHVGLRVLRK